MSELITDEFEIQKTNELSTGVAYDQHSVFGDMYRVIIWTLELVEWSV